MFKMLGKAMLIAIVRNTMINKDKDEFAEFPDSNRNQDIAKSSDGIIDKSSNNNRKKSDKDIKPPAEERILPVNMRCVFFDEYHITLTSQ